MRLNKIFDVALFITTILLFVSCYFEENDFHTDEAQNEVKFNDSLGVLIVNDTFQVKFHYYTIQQNTPKTRTKKFYNSNKKPAIELEYFIFDDSTTTLNGYIVYNTISERINKLSRYIDLNLVDSVLNVDFSWNYNSPFAIYFFEYGAEKSSKNIVVNNINEVITLSRSDLKSFERGVLVYLGNHNFNSELQERESEGLKYYFILDELPKKSR